MEKHYKLNWLARIVCTFWGLVCCIFLLTLPMGLILLFVTYNTRITLTDDQFTLRTMKKALEIPWKDVSEVEPGRSFALALLLGLYKNHIVKYKNLATGKKHYVPYKMFQNGEDLKANFTKLASS